MPMIITPAPGKTHEVGIINPSKRVGDTGQYTLLEGTLEELDGRLILARKHGFEIRWYYKNAMTYEGEIILSQLSMTEIPPGHVQPFHTHHTINETILVIQGSIMAIDSDELDESDLEKLLRNSVRVNQYQSVIQGPGQRHTIFNPFDKYASFIASQTARLPEGVELSADWSTDKPKSE